MLTFEEWEALWLLTLNQVHLEHNRFQGRMIATTSGGRDIAELFQQLKDKGMVLLIHPGWRNGEPSGWRIEITNMGWAAMDTRPERVGAEDASDE